MPNPSIQDDLLLLWRQALAEESPLLAATFWSGESSIFIPYDRLEIVTGATNIGALLALRARSYTSILGWSVLEEWSAGSDGAILVAAQRLRLRFVNGDADEERQQTLFLAATRTQEGWRLCHVAEAMPAIMLDVIGAYRRDAELAK